jgi:chromosome segregation ATPase
MSDESAPDAARAALLRDELAGVIARLDTLEQRSETLAARSQTVTSQLAEESARGEAQSGSLEGLSRSASAAFTRIDGEVARSDRVDDGIAAIIRRLDGLEAQLLKVAGRADGNAAAVDAIAKRFVVAEGAIRSGDLRLGILESKDETEV